MSKNRINIEVSESTLQLLEKLMIELKCPDTESTIRKLILLHVQRKIKSENNKNG